MKRLARASISVIASAAGTACLWLGFGAGTVEASDLDQTWSEGRLTWRNQETVASGAIAASVSAAAAAVGRRKAPAVIYLHGCSGLDEISSATANFLARAGYVVFSPDSFARADKPASCDVATHTSGLDRGALALRQAEAAHAAAEIRRLPFIDRGRVYLYGFSEGAIAAATATGFPVKARVVEGWTCHAGWPEYVGLRFPASQPVLTFTSKDDPWFLTPWTRGDCGAFLGGRAGSRSIVFAAPDALSHQHYVSGRADVQAIILDFLSRGRASRARD